MKLIFVTGGVVSSLGKGIVTASLASLLRSRGVKLKIRKLDPYLNVDPGTMSPYQHGEVYVTDDGYETDLDLGHYERFTNISSKQSDNITTGRIYSDVIKKERKGGYLGKTVQVIPHVTDRIREFIKGDITNEDFVICEIGGTVGDIESLPFVEAIRQFANEVGKNKSLFIHLTFVPFLKSSDESEGIRVKSPIIGTAYLAPEPGAKKFVEVGDKIKKGQTVMIVEAMKTMNHVPSTANGEVKKILVEDGQPVEFGQTLVILK